MLSKGGIILVRYEINLETLLIIPFSNGKSKIYEFDKEYIVNRVTLDIIKDSCLFFGCSYEGRRDAVKNIINVDMKVPILVEESHNIIFFPITSCVNKNSIWISYQNLVKYSKFNEFSTVLYFKNGKQIIVDVKYNLIDNQVIRCLKLKSLIDRRRDFIISSNVIIE